MGKNTSYVYYADDQIQTKTDARGATSTYTYNNRALVERIDYTMPSGSNMTSSSNEASSGASTGSEVIPNMAPTPCDPGDPGCPDPTPYPTPTPTPAPTPAPSGYSIFFVYDNLGNRIQMTDPMGTVSYEYDPLSEMTAEARQFNDYLPDAPMANNGKYRIEYTYTLSGQLGSLKDPFGHQSTYMLDKIGRLNTVNTNGYGDLTQSQPAVSSMQYRAFGSLKQANYGNSTQLTMQYNSRLQPSSFRLTYGSQILFGKDYSYSTGTNNDNDGFVKSSIDYYGSSIGTGRNRTNRYDAFGRISKSDAGIYGSTPFGSSITNGEFQQNFLYDHFGNITDIGDRDFQNNTIGCVGCPRQIGYSQTIVNDRTTTFGYDADGRTTQRGVETYQYEAAGMRSSANLNSSTTPNPSYAYDGDQKLVRLSENGAVKTYYIASTMLNTTVSELTGTGALDKDYLVMPTGSRIASMQSDQVTFIHIDPSGADEDDIKMDRSYGGSATYDPTGAARTGGSYGGGGPCWPNCPSPYNPPSGYYDSSMLTQMINQQRWQDQVFWNLSGYINLGIPVTSTSPPNGWNPQDGNLARISTDNAYIFPTTPGGISEGGHPLETLSFAELGYAALGASNIDGTSQQTRRPVELPKNFKDLIKQRLGEKQPGQTKDCNTFITEVIAKVVDTYNKEKAERSKAYNTAFSPYIPDAKTGYELLESVSKYTLDDNVVVAGHGAGGTVRGSIKGGDPEVVLQRKYYYLPVDRGSDPIKMWTNWYIGGGIHELVHLAGGLFSDGRLAKAVYDLGESTEPVTDPDTADPKKIFKYSGDWQDALSKYCGAR